MFKRSELISIILVGVLAMTVVTAVMAGGEDEYLVRIDISDPAVLDRLARTHAVVYCRSDQWVLAGIPSAHLGQLKGLTYRVLDETAWQRDYYLIEVRKPHQIEKLAPFGEILDFDGQTALIEISPEGAEKLPQLGFELVKISRTPKPLVSKPTAKDLTPGQFDPLIDVMVAQVSQESYTNFIQTLEDFQTRYTYTQGCDDAAEYIYQQFDNFGLTVEYHSYPIGGYTKRNVIGTLPGLVHPEEVLFIIAHYDCTSQTPNTFAPGADDNASGTSAVLEAARIMSNYNFARTINFVGFSGEEQGLVGSDYYVYDIFQAGMEVIGAFNYDMISWSGSDRYLDVCYDGASTALAEKIVEAAEYYVPESVVPQLFWGCGGSDHVSFWQYGYPSTMGIEGVGFNPNYHTTQDLVSNCDLEFATNVTKMAVAALADYAGPLAVEGSYLVVQTYLVDDDLLGDSQGDGDGVADFGERIELVVTLWNIGRQPATGVTATLSTDDPFITITDGWEQFGDIDSNTAATCLEDFDFEVATDCPDDHVVDFALTLNVDPGTLTFSLTVSAPLVGYRALTVDDSGGNNNGFADPGETVDVYITLLNEGGQGAANVAAVFSTDDPYLSINVGEASFGDIPPDGEATSMTSYNLEIDLSCPVPYNIPYTLNITADGGYSREIGSALAVGEGFTDDMEVVIPDWTHLAFTEGYKDEWHRSTGRNHTPGGSTSWKCGAVGSGNYSDLSDAALITPVINIGANFWLTFWHWIDAEIESGTDAWDGGIVMADDGSGWTQIRPLYGYPYSILDNPDSPFEGGTPCFSGTGGWTEVKFDLADYAGSAVRFMFRFGSDGYVTQEGWYIDDLTVEAGDFTLLDDFESGTSRWDLGTGWGLTGFGHKNSTAINDSPDHNYSNNADNSLTYLQSFDLSACSTAAVTYWHWHGMEEDHDWGYVEASADGDNWTQLARYTGFLGYPMHRGCVLLTPFCGQGGDSVRVRFRLVSDEAGTDFGWYLDDILFWHNILPADKGDVNCDEELNVLDVVRVVNIILGIGPDPTNFERWAADFDDNGEVNILDVVKIVNEILGGNRSSD